MPGRYTKVDVSESQLEQLVRENPGLIEEGLAFVDHQQRTAGGRLDVFLVDSGKALVLAELKVIQDDAMLVQALDYYDWVATYVESLARQYRTHSIDPTQQVRLFLIAPSFSQTLVSRCKWLNVPVSLFTFTCIKFEGQEEVAAIFSEREIGATPAAVEVSHLDDHLAYITDPIVRAQVTAFLDEIRTWKTGISVDAVKTAMSMKVNGRVFGYIRTRRKHYLVGTFDSAEQWSEVSVRNDEDVRNVKPVLKEALERRSAG